MKYVFNDFVSFEKRFLNKDLLLFFDYDGTLAPIADHPQKALLPAATRKLLKGLAESFPGGISIVTGRALADIRKLVGLREIAYVGNHGFEIDVPWTAFKGFDLLRTKEVLEYLKWEINKELMFFRGAFVEDKGASLSVHYRKVPQSSVKLLKGLLNEVTKPFVARKEIRIGLGKKVFEIRPPVDWDKGKAVLWLIEEYRNFFGVDFVPLYVGDDVTDEDAFKVLKKTGITIRVGVRKGSMAEYYFKNQKEVVDFLRDLAVMGRKLS